MVHIGLGGSRFAHAFRKAKKNTASNGDQQASEEMNVQAVRGDPIGVNDGSAQDGMSTSNKTSLLNIRKRREQALIEDSANQNPQVGYSQGQVILG